MEAIIKLWFNDGRIYILTDQNNTYSRPLEAFPILLDATDEQRKWELCTSQTGRRTFISYNVMKCHTEAEVRKCSGHKSVKTFERYIIFDEDCTVRGNPHHSISINLMIAQTAFRYGLGREKYTFYGLPRAIVLLDEVNGLASSTSSPGIATIPPRNVAKVNIFPVSATFGEHFVANRPFIIRSSATFRGGGIIQLQNSFHFGMIQHIMS